MSQVLIDASFILHTSIYNVDVFESLRLLFPGMTFEAYVTRCTIAEVKQRAAADADKPDSRSPKMLAFLGKCKHLDCEHGDAFTRAHMDRVASSDSSSVASDGPHSSEDDDSDGASGSSDDDSDEEKPAAGKKAKVVDARDAPTVREAAGAGRSTRPPKKAKREIKPSVACLTQIIRKLMKLGYTCCCTTLNSVRCDYVQ